MSKEKVLNIPKGTSLNCYEFEIVRMGQEQLKIYSKYSKFEKFKFHLKCFFRFEINYMNDMWIVLEDAVARHESTMEVGYEKK